MVYLCTIARVLPETLGGSDLRDVSSLTREEVGDFIRDAWDNPIAPPGAAGRPRAQGQGSIVEKLVVFMEKHATGEPHFHIAVKLVRALKFVPTKRTLRERHRLPSHWSVSHTNFWSAVRYGCVPSPRKPEVDENPYQWTSDGQVLDLFEESQEPFLATAWKRRREQKELQAASDQKKRKVPFSKLDLTAVILHADLRSPAAVLAYAQDRGTPQMQQYVHKQQRDLPKLIEDAEEWGRARETAAQERETDWALVCRTATSACPHGDECRYAIVAARFFEANRSLLSKDALAAALRNIVVNGPSKTTRVPVLVGPTNTGKTTLLLPFDKLFQFRHVFHKPALGSKFALRNITKSKRFIFWDDYRPVEYAMGTVPVATFLSLFEGKPFEVQMSQSFNDGNVDFEWRRGAVLTAKKQGLWDLRGDISEEDVRHMQSRVDVYECSAKVSQLQHTDACEVCMCKWICDGAAARDAAPVSQPALAPPPGTSGQQGREVSDLDTFIAQAQVSAEVAAVLAQELRELGVVHVSEVGESDWPHFQAWRMMRPYEQRRVLSACRGQRRHL